MMKDEEEYERVMQDLDKYIVKEYKKLWGKLQVPCTLEEALDSMTKEDLHHICRKREIPRYSSLNKPALVSLLHENILETPKALFPLWDQTQLEMINRLTYETSIEADDDMEPQQLEVLRRGGLVFTGTSEEGVPSIFMPEEVRNALLQHPVDNELQQIIDRNTEWVNLTHGLLLGYGALTMDAFFEKIRYYLEGHPPMAYFHVLSEAREFYNFFQFYPDLDAAVISDLVGPEFILEEQELRQDVSFYPFTKEELIEAGAPGYMDRNPFFLKLTNYLQEKHGLDQELADVLADESTMYLRESADLAFIMEEMATEIKIAGLEEATELMDILVELSNNTRQWILKGYTPIELREEAQMNPLPPKDNVVPFVKKEKIGRNSPCPCGSGKKYKKCCGQ